METCCVCLDSSECVDVTTLPCGHSMHAACLVQVLLRGSINASCPLCRCPMRVDTDEVHLDNDGYETPSTSDRPSSPPPTRPRLRTRAGCLASVQRRVMSGSATVRERQAFEKYRELRNRCHVERQSLAQYRENAEASVRRMRDELGELFNVRDVVQHVTRHRRGRLRTWQRRARWAGSRVARERLGSM